MQRPGTNKRLNKDQEKVVCDYIDQCEEIGTYAQQNDIRSCADYLLLLAFEGNPDEAPLVGPKWEARFLDQHPQFHWQKQKSREIKRKQANHPDSIREWYDGFAKLRSELGIPDSDVWNMDEIGFTTGLGSDQYLYARDTTRRKELGSNMNKSHITIIEAVSADGRVIHPVCIVQGVKYMSKWITDDMDANYGFVANESGYMNDESMMAWIPHFNRLTKGLQLSGYRLLLLDGYGAHCTKEFIDYCDQAQIKLYCLPPNTSHLMQPLDISVFSPYKHWHTKAIERETRVGCADYNKAEFFNSLAGIRHQTFKPSTIREGFRAAGLIPFNPDLVLSKMQETEAIPRPRPIIPESQVQLNIPTTPLTIRGLCSQAAGLLDTVMPQLNAEGVHQLSKFLSGAEFQAISGAQAKHSLLHTETAEQARANQKRRKIRHLSSGGLLLASEAREMVRKKDSDKLEELERKASRLRDKAVKQAERAKKTRQVALRKAERLEKAKQKAEAAAAKERNKAALS